MPVQLPSRDELLASPDAQRRFAADLALAVSAGEIDPKQCRAATALLKEIRQLDALADLYEQAGRGLQLLKEILRRKGLTADEAARIVASLKSDGAP